MKYETILSILKYLGFFLTAVSAVWTATRVENHEVRGKKVVTIPGKISIVFVLIGVLLSVVSNILQDRLDDQKKQDAQLSELRRTQRIILAGQPLISIDMEWTFPDSAGVLQRDLDSGLTRGERYQEGMQGEVASSQGEGIYEEYSFYPVLNEIFNGPKSKDFGFLTLLPLDNEHNAVLPFGIVKDSTQWAFKEFKEIGDSSTALPLGFHFSMDPEGLIHGYSSGYIDPDNVKFPFLAPRKDSIALRWYLDPLTFSVAFNKANQDFNLTSNLPKILRIVVLNHIKNLPFNSRNLAFASNYDLWADAGAKVNDSKNYRMLAGSTLSLIPNGLADQAFIYKVKRVYQQTITSNDYGEDIECKGVVIEMVLSGE